jgi:hypothetical protein
MIRRLLCLSVFLASSPLLLPAQDCKIKFSAVYNDGHAMQVGLTAEQKKMWDRDGAKKFKGMCFDPREPNFIILWSEGLNGAELAKASVDHFNVLRTTGEAPTTTTAQRSWASAGLYIRPSSQVREKAEYVVLDTSKTPYFIVRQGQGYQDVPQSRGNSPGQKVSTSDLASTIADPTAALENALKWLKKEKKL